MNKVELLGRLTRDPDIRFTSGDNPTTIARYTLAVDRRIKRMMKTAPILSAASPLERMQSL